MCSDSYAGAWLFDRASMAMLGSSLYCLILCLIVRGRGNDSLPILSELQPSLLPRM